MRQIAEVDQIFEQAKLRWQQYLDCSSPWLIAQARIAMLNGKLAVLRAKVASKSAEARTNIETEWFAGIADSGLRQTPICLTDETFLEPGCWIINSPEKTAALADLVAFDQLLNRLANALAVLSDMVNKT